MKKGYSKRESCLITTAMPQEVFTTVKTAKSKRCDYPIGIKIDSTYVCLNQVKALRSEKKAIASGYSHVASCRIATPTPTSSAAPTITPTPQVTITPLPRSLSFQLEDGIRHSNMAASSTLLMNNGTFKAYLGVSTSSFDQKTISYATSADGLSWNNPTNISGITLGTSETLTNPATFFLANGQLALLYEGIKHISSAGLDMHTLNLMTSVNGASFSNPFAGSIASSISGSISPGIVRIDSNTLRAYYGTISGVTSAVSTDEGATWTKEDGVFQILGCSETFAYSPHGLNVIKLANGTYRLFFGAYSSLNSMISRIYTATSSDGKNFTVEDGPLVEPANPEYRHTRPDAIILPDGRIRVYFSEQYGGFDSLVKNIRSLISQ